MEISYRSYVTGAILYVLSENMLINMSTVWQWCRHEQKLDISFLAQLSGTELPKRQGKGQKKLNIMAMSSHLLSSCNVQRTQALCGTAGCGGQTTSHFLCWNSISDFPAPQPEQKHVMLGDEPPTKPINQIKL